MLVLVPDWVFVNCVVLFSFWTRLLFEQYCLVRVNQVFVFISSVSTYLICIVRTNKALSGVQNVDIHCHILSYINLIHTCFQTKPTTDENEVEAYIYAMKIPHRLDKKKDRVEISSDQLIAAREFAEKLSQKFNREVRVLGWFHSHPHITVWPSHVGKRTYKQAMIDLNKFSKFSSFVDARLLCSQILVYILLADSFFLTITIIFCLSYSIKTVNHCGQ